MTDNPTSPEVKAPVATAPKTRGDRMFDRWVYGGLNGAGTFLLTLPLAYWAKHGGGQEPFENMGKGLAELKLGPLHLGEKTAKDVVSTTALGLGGTVMVPAVWVAEHYRTPIVQWLNQQYGSAEDKTAPPHNVTPQTWGSLLSSRLAAWGVVFSSIKAVGLISQAVGHGKALDNFEHGFSKVFIGKILRMPTHTIAAEEVKALKALGTDTALKTLANSETKAFRYGKIGALDIFATAAASSIFYVSSRFFAKQDPVKTQEKPHVPAVQAGVQENEQTPPASGAVAPQPQTTVAGVKMHPGMVGQSAASQQVGV